MRHDASFVHQPTSSTVLVSSTGLRGATWRPYTVTLTHITRTHAQTPTLEAHTHTLRPSQWENSAMKAWWWASKRSSARASSSSSGRNLRYTAQAVGGTRQTQQHVMT